MKTLVINTQNTKKFQVFLYVAIIEYFGGWFTNHQGCPSSSCTNEKCFLSATYTWSVLSRQWASALSESVSGSRSVLPHSTARNHFIQEDTHTHLPFRVSGRGVGQGGVGHPHPQANSFLGRHTALITAHSPSPKKITGKFLHK